MEIDRLRTKLAEFEKERKTESPKIQSRYWTPGEHKRFIDALQKFGPKDVRAIANFVGSRNATQVRTHAQKYFLRVAREAKNVNALSAARKRSMSESDLARVGRSVRTPPGSPMREAMFSTNTTFNPCSSSDTRMTDLDTGPSLLAQPPPLPPPLVKMEALPGVGSTKPPVGVTGGKPPRDGKLQDNTGINLLSLVASTRKMEADKGIR